MRTSLYGIPLPFSRSKVTVLVVEPNLGYSGAQPETDLSLGQTPETVNWFMRDGALEPRSRLSIVASNANPTGVTVTGGVELISSVGTYYPIVSGTTRVAYYSQGSWSVLSYVSSAGRSTPPSGGTSDYYDIIQSYYPDLDEMIGVLACESYQTLFWFSAGSTILSSATGAPRARHLAVSDNFVLAANIRDVGSAQSKYIQRVQWTDRGGPLTWTPATTNLAGNQDLLDATGEITALAEIDSGRVAVFFQEEIWQGFRGTSPNIWQFAPLDKTIGTTFKWTIVRTPLGIIFLGNDYMLYLLPKDGGGATPIGKAIQKRLRETIDAPTRAHAVYEEGLNAYRLFYPTRGSGSVPTREATYNLTEGSIALQDYGLRAVTRAFPAYLQQATSGITWGGLLAAGYTWGTLPYTWGQMVSTSTAVNRTIYAGSSDGTVWFCSSTETRDDGASVEARWRTGALGEANPEGVKCVNQVRVEGRAMLASSLTVRCSRDQGQTMDAGQSVSFPVTSTLTQRTAWLQTVAPYPMVEITTEDIGVRVNRLWVQLRQGGEPN